MDKLAGRRRGERCGAQGGSGDQVFGGRKPALESGAPGPGNSTPIISGEQLIVTCGIEGKDAVVSYDPNGKELWRTVFGEETPGKGGNKQKGTGSNSSPVTDGRGIFSYFKSGRVAALTMKGKKVWELDLHDKYGKDTLWWDEGRLRCWPVGSSSWR